MSLINNNTTISVTANETALSQLNTSCGPHVLHTTVERISVIFLFSVNLMGSFFGNIFIIVIVYKHRDLRKTMNYSIVSMAVSDLLLPLIVIPVNIVGFVTDSWQLHVSGNLGSSFCKLFSFSSAVALHVSVQSLVWIAIDRFVTGLFNSPLLIISDIAIHENKNTFCDYTGGDSVYNSNVLVAFLFAQFFMLFIVPLVVLTVLYTAIAIVLKRQNEALNDIAQNLQRHTEKKRRQAIRMAIVIVVLFYIYVIPSTLPYFAAYSWTWTSSCASQRLLFSLASFVYSSFSMVNAIICLSFC